MKNPLTRSFVQLLLYMRPFRSMYLSATIFSFLNKFFDLMPEILLGIAVNTVVQKEHSWLANLGFYNLKTQLFLLGFLTLVSHALESLFEYLYSIRWWRLAQLVQHNFRMEAFNHVQKSTMTIFSKQKTGNLLSILNDDINQLERFLEEGIDEIIEIVGTSLLVGTIFFFLAPQIAIFVVIPIIFIIYGTFFFQKKLSPLYLTIREKAGFLGTRLANSLLGLLTIKSLVAEELEKERLEEASLSYKEANFQAIKWGALIVPIIRFAIVSGFLVTLIYGGILTLDEKLDIGVYSTLIFLTQRLLWPFTDMAEIMINFQRVMASTRRLLGLLQFPLEESPNTTISLQGGIRFEDVGFAYENHGLTLTHLNFEIQPGETVAFVGATGAGKTTLLHLLLGFYYPTKGYIYFDGQEIRDLSLPNLRKQLAFVSQEPYLFEGTIAENISYAYPQATKEKIIQAAKNASAHDFIMELPQGYDTLVGERAQSLSGGQKQRIAIARAIVRNPAILILDEATSAVDNATELAIQQALAKIGKERTMILIAHRLATVKQANKIFVLHQGTIAEQGTHEQLLKNDLLYANLWKLQTGENLTHAELITE
jgi:ATP-binding cassette subfamily B protein